MDELDPLLAEQVSYYRARGGDYDEAYRGRESWDEVVDLLPIRGDVLELACGTGRWTPLLAARARSVTAVDAAPEMIEVARRRVTGLPVEFICADIFTWCPTRAYDTVFFGFWLSHVPPGRFATFWSAVAGMLRDPGAACFLDSNPEERDLEELLPGAVPTVRRTLGDGREYRVVKVFYTADQLADELRTLGWSTSVRDVYGRFLLGVATRPPAGATDDRTG